VSLFKSIKARAAKTVEIDGIGTFYLRVARCGEGERIRIARESQSHNWLTMAFILVDSAGVPLIPAVDGETDSQLADRAKAECSDLTPSQIEAIAAAYEKAMRPPTPERLEKN
jgi:hypothetical protein